MSSRADLHTESTVYLQEKDQYREQVRQLTERCDWQQLQLLRSKGEVLQLQTRVRRLTCSTHQVQYTITQCTLTVYSTQGSPLS